jgi:DNA-binding CsgD family transcriptional regulator
MRESLQLSRAVGSIYDASVDRTLWPAALEAIAGFIPAAVVNLFSEDVVQKSVRVFYCHGMRQKFQDLYAQKYIRLNPFFPATLFFDAGYVITEADIIPRSEMQQTQFYREWVQPQGIGEMMAAILEKSATSVAAIAVALNQSQGPVDETAVRRMTLIVPHVRRAVAIGKVIDLHRTEAAAFADTLDGVAAATLFVDVAACLVYANAAGEALLEQGVIVCDADNRLTFCDTDAGRALHDVIFQIGREEPVSDSQAVSLPITADNGERYVAHVLALTSGARRKTGVGYHAAAAIFVQKASFELPHPLETIAATFSLTPAEMRVLMMLVQVGSVPEVAPVLGISEATAKTHLQHIYAKTGAKRQADLVKLVAGYMSPVTCGPPREDRAARTPSRRGPS